MTSADEVTVYRPGELLAGRYRLRSRLGAGAMGVVWLAVDERLDRPVAVKVLWPGPAQSEQARARIVREGRIAARLRHPHAVTVHDVAEHDGQPVLVMEYLPSRSLATVVAEGGPQPPRTVARIGEQIASALAAAHAAGVVHRDVKPGNVLVGDDGSAKLADFGISRATGDAALTQAGLVAGTPAYLAPEIARGWEPGPEADVFSLGSTLYAAVEGVPPFGADENSIALLHRVAAGQVAPPSQRGHAGPLAPVLTAVLRADPARRPGAAQVATALRAVADGQPVPPGALDAARTRPVATPAAATVPVRPAGGTRVDNRPVAFEGRRRKRFLLPAAGAALALLAVVVLVLQMSPDPPAPAQAAPAATIDTAALTRAVGEYYALLPGRPDNAWTHLGPRLQAQGVDAYRARWAGVTALTVTVPPAVAGENQVSVTISYTLSDGRVVTEPHRLGLIPAAPAPLIDTDDVLASDTSTPPPPAPTPDQPKGKGGKDAGDGKHGKGDKKGDHRPGPGRGHGPGHGHDD